MEKRKAVFIDEIRGYFGGKNLLTNIRYFDLEAFRNHLRQRITRLGTIFTDANINLIISCLRYIFYKAVEWEMIEENPFKKGKSPILKENNKRLRFLYPRQRLKRSWRLVTIRCGTLWKRPSIPGCEEASCLV